MRCVHVTHEEVEFAFILKSTRLSSTNEPAPRRGISSTRHAQANLTTNEPGDGKHAHYRAFRATHGVCELRGLQGELCHDVPNNFDFARDVVDAWAQIDPGKRALVYCTDEEGSERTFSFGDISELSKRAAAGSSRTASDAGTASSHWPAGAGSIGSSPWPCAASARCPCPAPSR